VVGNYRIGDQLGQGGMGAVYRAEHTQLGKKAAVKVLLEELSNNKDLVARFFNEARAATAIDHPGIVGVFDFGYAVDRRAYIVMEFLDGETLGERRRRLGRLPVPEALTICRQVAGALGAAHARGIVHRDLKPDNIMLVRDPDVLGGQRAKVLDFGIAKLTEREDGGPDDTLPAVKTNNGKIMGTPAYMAPEQCRGAGDVDHRADMYALGCVLYTLVCGRPPFLAEASGDLIAAHLLSEPPSPRTVSREIPEPVEEVMLRLLAKRPDDRYASMAEVVMALEGASAGALPEGLGRRASAVHVAERGDLVPTVDDKPRQPTTLGSAARQSAISPSPTSSRRWRAVGVAVVAAAIGLVVRVRTPHVRETSTSPIPLGGPAGAPTLAAAPAASPAPPAPRAPPPTRLSPSRVALTIISQPPGASVTRASDGVRVGVTPVIASAPRGAGDVRFIVKRQGFREEVVGLDAAADGTRQVMLRPIGRRAPGAPSSASAVVTKDTRSAVTPAPARHAAKPIEDGALDPYSP
jgi:serine/threonine protein kinase